MDFSIHQKISTLSSNTWFTGLTAFLDRLKQRYCFVARRNGVISSDELDGIATFASVNRSEWDLRMVKTRCRDRSLVRMAWVRRSFSLHVSVNVRVSRLTFP
jgi:hypothetical protein